MIYTRSTLNLPRAGHNATTSSGSLCTGPDKLNPPVVLNKVDELLQFSFTGTQVMVMGSSKVPFGVLYNSTDTKLNSLTNYPAIPPNFSTSCQVLFNYDLPDSTYMITIGHPYNNTLPINIDFIGFKTTDGTGEASNNTQAEAWIPINFSELNKFTPSGSQFSKSGFGASRSKTHPTPPEIAGLVLGVISLIIALGLVFYFLRRRARRRAQYPNETKPTTSTTSSHGTARGIQSLTRDSGFFTQTTDSMEKHQSRGDRGGHGATLSDQYDYERNVGHGGDTAINITGPRAGPGLLFTPGSDAYLGPQQGSRFRSGFDTMDEMVLITARRPQHQVT
ncbi:hypothetical protein SISSUDRAFT_541507 [Sistotremastrum suecicum HHB10207 ss-3]|uniref:Uncharacterized protein n=1 Tax=Sistotremastrum suecicum HHB10207 ss-3 TaxID=1314776 RepID=A0A166F207_9AGAM|nr:hypothetical protein SISSUDRAFT_541507 [Sistotremastrum suecicum HHB10207 ss-3]